MFTKYIGIKYDTLRAYLIYFFGEKNQICKIAFFIARCVP